MGQVWCCNNIYETRWDRKRGRRQRKRERKQPRRRRPLGLLILGTLVFHLENGPEIVSRSEHESKTKITFPQEVQCTLSAPSLRPSAMVVSLLSPLVRIPSLPSTFWSSWFKTLLKTIFEPANSQSYIICLFRGEVYDNPDDRHPHPPLPPLPLYLRLQHQHSHRQV